MKNKAENNALKSNLILKKGKIKTILTFKLSLFDVIIRETI